MENDLRPVTPAEPAAGWMGGKSRLARRICEIINRTPHQAYAEPFVGMGGVFLRRTLRPPVEVINDASGDIVTLMRVLQRHPDALLRELRWRPASRVEFDRLKGARIQDLTDIERAARFLYLQTLAFGGKAVGRNFGTSAVTAQTFSVSRLEARLRRIHDRLCEVVIEHLDWSDFIPRYARPETLFYVDPPYWGCEDDYGTGLFAPGDFVRLATALEASGARVLVSINDAPEIRAAFAWGEIEAVTTRYHISGEGGQAVEELLIGLGVPLAAAAPQARLI